MSSEASPVVELPVPLASVLTTLMLQLARVAIAGFGIASGGPKKQFATGWQLSPMPPQSASDVQALCGSAPLQVPPVPQPVAVQHVAPGVGPPPQTAASTHSLAGPAPLVQSTLTVTLLATSALPEPRSRWEEAPAGTGPPGTATLAPPPTY